MKNVIAWIKSNPITVLSALLIVFSVGFMGWIKLVKSPALIASATQPQKDLSRLKSLQRQTLEVPPANADDPVEEISGITVNPPVVQAMGQIIGGLNHEADEIRKTALGINQAGHDLLVEGLFPDAPADKRFTAKINYGKALEAMMGGPDLTQTLATNTGISTPYINAGLPMAADEIGIFMAQRQAEALQSRDAALITETDQKQLEGELQRELMNRLLEHAQRFNVYGDPSLGDPRSPNPAFPLEVAPLGTQTRSPAPEVLWEGQLQLWILEDLMQAIALANDVANTRDHGTDEKGQRIDSSVLNAPVKRLIEASLLPGYVGLHSVGGVGSFDSTRGRSETVSYGPPAGGLTNQPRETKLSDNFHYGPTGRGSNQIFDVRHARLRVHADYQRLPELFNAISNTNLMTVLDVQMTALDVYGPEVLGQYYVYGAGDIIDVSMIVETIWLRDWTKDLMPETVQQYVGLVEPASGSVAPGGVGAGYGGYGGYGDDDDDDF